MHVGPMHITFLESLAVVRWCTASCRAIEKQYGKCSLFPKHFMYRTQKHDLGNIGNIRPIVSCGSLQYPPGYLFHCILTNTGDGGIKFNVNGALWILVSGPTYQRIVCCQDSVAKPITCSKSCLIAILWIFQHPSSAPAYY